jgi:hypothetical protein
VNRAVTADATAPILVELLGHRLLSGAGAKRQGFVARCPVVRRAWVPSTVTSNADSRRAAWEPMPPTPTISAVTPRQVHDVAALRFAQSRVVSDCGGNRTNLNALACSSLRWMIVKRDKLDVNFQGSDTSSTAES